MTDNKIVSKKKHGHCAICKSPTDHIFSEKILHKYECDYFYCYKCGFLHTEKPFWLDEAYGSPIVDADTGLVQRNIGISKLLATIIFYLFDSHGKYLDVAGGYGMLTRLMRDVGFNFFWSDKYCGNLLARGFEGKANAGYIAVTAFEVMEHVHNPLEFIEEIMANYKTKTIIFSTELFVNKPPNPSKWWYYAFETGQHISFYKKETLQAIGDKLNLNFYSSNGIHVLTDKKINRWKLWFITYPRITRVLFFVIRRSMDSRTMADHFNVIKKIN